jgi:AcrR family transcriptional regulator
MPRGDRSLATRDALIRAAARVFVSRGPYGARVRDIAREAGLTVPALYYHFTGTEALYDQVVQDGRDRFVRTIEAALATPGAARSRLLAIARGYAAFGREDPVRLRILCLEFFRPRLEPDPALDALGAWLRGAVEAVLAAGIGAGELPPVDPVLARRLFEAILNGLLVEQASTPDTAILDDAVAEQAVAVLLDGLRGIAP